jgi:raffinose/stachyose/melibiose transport system substrate-binding protein
LVIFVLAYALAAVFVLRRTVREAVSDRIVLRVSQWQLEGGVRQAFEAMARRYEQLNPRVRVVTISIPDTLYQQWAKTQLVGENGPDVVEYGTDFHDVPRFFAPITDEVMKPNPYNRGTPLEQVPWRDTFLDAMANPDGFNTQLNQYYAPTLTQHSMRLIYNRPMLRAITGAEEPPRNYREFVALCDRVRAYAREHKLLLAPLANSKDTVIGVAGYVFDAAASGLAARLDRRRTLVLASTDLGIGYLRGEWNFHAPEARIGFELLENLGANSMPGFLQLTRDAPLTDFVRQRALMIIAPSWEASSLKEICNFELGAFRYPVPLQDDPVYGRHMLGPYSDGKMITMMAMYINRTSRHRREALDFLHFITSVEGNQIFTDVSTWLPAISGVKASDYSRQFLPFYEGYSWGVGFMNLSGVDTTTYIRNRYYLLWGPTGSAQAYADALDRDLPPRVRTDFTREVSTQLRNLIREDSAAAAARLLAGPEAAGTAVPLLPALLEGRTYQLIDALREARAKEKP